MTFWVNLVAKRMGIDTVLWRARIGAFTQPVKRRSFYPVLVIGNVSLGIRVLLFLLLAMQCVELNPGPGPGSRTTRGQDARRGSSGYSPNNTSARGRGAINSSVTEQRCLRSGSATTPSGMHNTIGTGLSQAQAQATVSQPPINAWFGSPNTYNTPSTSNSLRSTSDTNLAELKDIMLEVQRSQNNMETRFSKFESSLNSVMESHSRLLESNKQMNETVGKLSQKVDKLEEKLKVSEEKCERMEAQSRRENLKFYGLEQNGNESWDETEEKVREYLQTDLEMDHDGISIERAHRIPGKEKPNPVIVKFSFFKDKEKVLKQYRLKRKEFAQNAEVANTENENESGEDDRNQLEVHSTFRNNIHISEDFPRRVMNVRNALRPFLRDALKDGKSAYIKYDKLVINDETFAYEESSETLVKVIK